MTAPADSLPPAPAAIDWFSPWTLRALADVGTERLEQDERFPESEGGFPSELRSDILGEEVGEVAKAHLELVRDGAPVEDLRSELVQVAATAVRWIETLDRELVDPPARTISLPVDDVLELHRLASMVRSSRLTDDEFRRALEVGGRVEDVLQAAGAQPWRPFGMTEVHDVA